MTKEAEIAKTLMPYLVLFSNNKINDEALMMYARVLCPLSIAEIDAAMRKLATTSKFFPAVAEIFEAAQSIREQAEGKAIPTAAEAWGEAMGLVRKIGSYGKWEYSCPEVEKTVKMFGRDSLCMLEESQTATARAQFMRMYSDIIKRNEEIRKNDEVLSTIPSKQLEALTGKIIQLAEVKKEIVGAAV